MCIRNKLFHLPIIVFVSHKKCSFHVSFSLPNLLEVLVPPNVPFECSIPEGVSLQLKAYFYENTSAVMVQFHTLMDKLTLWSSDPDVENTTGYHGGILQYATISQSGAPWYLASSVNHTVNAIIMVTFFTENGMFCLSRAGLI